jgi:hypothetical protein
MNNHGFKLSSGGRSKLESWEGHAIAEDIEIESYALYAEHVISME